MGEPAYDGAVPGTEVWSQFEHDPRAPANRNVRASDRDRALIETVLADAFAEGRITRTEYDERTDAALASRTLGDLVPLVSDLPVAHGPRSTPTDLRQQAVRKWQSDRREAVLGLIGLSVLLWTIWALTMWGDFPWPLFPTGFGIMNVVRIVARKQDLIDEHVRELEEKELKEAKRREQLG